VTRQRLTVQDAAEVLGVSVDAVRMRVRRGSLEAEKDDSGRVYVRLDADEDKVKSQRQVESSDLVEDLRDQVAYLRDQLDRERGARTEERRRHDTIIAQLMQRIPELEPAAGTGADQEQPDPPETAAAEPERVDTGPATAGSQTSAQRSWWRRVFGR
jgi:excisionase family DNA binding protein